MRIISGVVNTRFDRRPRARSLQRTPMQVIAVAFAACAFAFGAVAFAAGGPSHDVSAALAAAVADSSRPDSDTTRDADRKPEKTLAFVGIKPGTGSRTMSPTQAISRVSSPASSGPRATFMRRSRRRFSNSSISLRQLRSCRAMLSLIQT